MTATPLHARPACEIADAVRAGTLRAADVLEHHLERIGRLNDRVGAFVHRDADGARAAARAIDAGVARSEDPGPLAGVPIGVKELEDVAGWPHTLAARVFADLFEEIDALLLPTTATPAFAAAGPMPSTIAGRPVSPLATVAPTYVFNLSGHPAVSVPAGMVGGAPIGLQIVGRRHDDLRVLALAMACERLRPWPLLAPAAP